jgi:hypothetical protein
MKLAFVQSSRRGGTDQLLSDFAMREIAAGKRVIGVVQINTERPHDHRCDMDVQVLPDGDRIRISQDLGANSRGCRLDSAALEQAVAELEPQVEAGADLLVINKFGKHEADGRGFRILIARAVELDIPVIVGTNALNKEAFQNFSAGCATELRADVEHLEEWLLGVRFDLAG